MRKRLGALAVAFALLAGAAQAAVLPIAGAFGNEPGCHFFMSGEALDEMMVLTGDTVSVTGGGCDFVRLLGQEGEVFTVEAICAGQGQAGSSFDKVVVTRLSDAEMMVQVEGAAEWGPLRKCAGSEDALSPGVHT
jgi:hypothetical protein